MTLGQLDRWMDCAKKVQTPAWSFEELNAPRRRDQLFCIRLESTFDVTVCPLARFDVYNRGSILRKVPRLQRAVGPTT